MMAIKMVIGAGEMELAYRPDPLALADMKEVPGARPGNVMTDQ